MPVTGVVQSGQLSDFPLAELIRETSQAGFTGAFRLSRERMKTVLYFEAGSGVFAASNLRMHRLSECIRRYQIATQQQIESVGQFPNDAELAVALLKAGVLSSDLMNECLCRQMADVMRPALLWTDGDWTFDVRVRLADNVRAIVSFRDLMMDSARRLPIEFISRRFSNYDEILTPIVDPELARELLPGEAFVLSRFERRELPVRELMAVSSLPEPETLRAIYVLTFGEFITRERWPRAFTEETTNRFRSAAQTSKRTQPVFTMPSPVTTATSVPVSKVANANKASDVVNEKRELNQFLARVESADNFYDVLGIPRAAEQAAVKQAYHSIARRFHPDRFHHETGTQLHARLQAAFAHVAQAQEALKDVKVRASYDLRLEQQQRSRGAGNANRSGSGLSRTPTSAPIGDKAERSFQDGLAAMKQGNFNAAIAFLAEAVRNAPREPRIRSAYASALAKNPRATRQAETEFQEAITLEPRNPIHRVKLAEFYRDHGMLKRAQGELERALSIDPAFDAALKLLDELKARG